jgi:hypothetical protein
MWLSMRDFFYRMLVPPPVTRKRKRAAMIVAGFIDFVQMFTWPITLMPVISAWGDVVAAVALVLICGFRWQFIVGFAIEAIPAVALCPTWLAVTALLPVKADERPSTNDVQPYLVAQPPALPEGKAKS